MSPTQTTVAPTGSARADDTSTYKLTQRRVIRSEWIKLRSVRSTVIALALTGVAVAAFGVLVSMLSSGGGIGSDDGPVVADPAGNSLFGSNIAQLVLGVLGALLITTEYSTGQIRSTLTTVPTRVPVLWAKVMVTVVVTFATMIVGVMVAFFAGQARTWRRAA